MDEQDQPDSEVRFFEPQGDGTSKQVDLDPETETLFQTLTERQKAIMQAISIAAGMENGMKGSDDTAETLLHILQIMGLRQDEYEPLVNLHNDMVDRIKARRG